MYQCIIQFKNNLPEETLREMKSACDKAFDNRAGRVVCTPGSDPFRLVYEGAEECFGCLQLGILALNKVKSFKECLFKWDWIDEEPNENHCILEALAMPLYCKGKLVNA